MRCPFCGHQDSRVVDSRDVDDSVRRRRECLNPDCAGRFTTYERVQAVALYVVKKDGRREEFSREKLTAGLRKACEKRPLPAGSVESLAADIEAVLYQGDAPEVASTALGELVMDRLRRLDPIAYVRFASVYRQFADLEALREELETLLSGTVPGAAQLPFGDPAFTPGTRLGGPSIRLRPAAPTERTRTRRPVRPVQTPVPIRGGRPAPRERPKRGDRGDRLQGTGDGG
jgi:transcriptional repressor NrdR